MWATSVCILFFCFIYTSCPIGDIAIISKCTDSKPRPWWTCVCTYVCAGMHVSRLCMCAGMHVSCLSKCACANRYEASSRVLCSSEKITLRPRFQTPARDKTRWQHCIVISPCLSNVASRCTCTHTHAHRCCQQFPSFQTPLTPKWDRVCGLGADNPPGIHTLCFTVPSQYQRLLINFLKRLFTLLNFSCWRVRVYQKQW